MTHKMNAVQKADRCEPDTPAPGTQNEPCQGTLQGSISGTVTMECCCPRIQTRTFILQLGPQSEANLQTFLQNTVTSWEASNYMVLGHSLVDTGAGWLLGLTIGWYQ